MTQTPITLEQIESVLDLQARHGSTLSAAELLAAENHLAARQAQPAMTDQAMPSGEQGGENDTSTV